MTRDEAQKKVDLLTQHRSRVPILEILEELELIRFDDDKQSDRDSK